jgi:mxaD protein
MKNILVAAVLLGSMLAGTAALADPPKPLKVSKTVHINAPVDKVWDAVKDFASLPKWHPGFSEDKITKGENNKVGAVRTLTVKDGPSFKEELLAFDDANHTYKYRIIESPLPLRDYHSTMSVQADPKGGARVRWSGVFKRKSTSDTPPDNENDEAATKLVTGVYEGGLANLKKMLEGK